LRPFFQRRPFFIDLKSQKKTPAEADVSFENIF